MAGNEEEHRQPPSTSSSAPSSRPPHPTITLPPRTCFETMFNNNNSGTGGNTGAGLGFSPGPMTLVSSFFSDGEDCKSFSQLLAGAMLSPADRAAFPPLEDRNSGDDSSDFRFKNGPAGMSIGPLSPMFPAGFLDSPGGLFSPGQGAFGMTHQQALAQVTAQASQSQSYTFHIPNEHSTSKTQLPIFTSSTTPPQEMPSEIPDSGVTLKESSDISHSEQRSQPSSLTVDKPNDDGYNWRKYGQKQVKGSEFPRSYYKCTHPSCPVKKKVERSVDGQITEIIYKGEHNHQRPQSKRPKDSGNQNGNVQVNHDLASQVHGGNLNKSKEGTYSMSKLGQESSQAISGTSDSEEVGDAETKVEEKDEDEPAAKRRNMEVRHSEPASSHRTVTEPRIIVQTTSEVDLLDDGYRWRKYGQKVVKGNPYPRSYYKCTFQGCNVRKHVERAATDPKAVITTYEGKHNHDVPASKSGSHYAANNNASNLRSGNPGTEKHASVSKMDPRNNDQQHVARLRLKEEQIT
ncbi:putative transcription factor WRKY family [Rosa chinensis]|uniref:Putative transcription factor WRKY family n=1 Tax=Rosa chinensis TaxID=74649 RepID=A0A2P6R2R7_ROSCH|nr:probable WRKY transcription factor 3 [Rosa chinensis]PRQ40711.1 putative transcription factor WRKY family [Rosa chinensis]